MAAVSRRPKYLNLVKIRLPIPGIVSFAHRVSGVLMFLAIPFFAWLLHLSVVSEAGYGQVASVLQLPLIKLGLLLLAWSVYHHLFAGIRYLLIDVDIGVDLISARTSAVIVFISGLVAAAITLMVIM